MKKILLIGGSGYIGSVVAKYFLSLGFNVRILDNLLFNNNFSTEDLNNNKNFDFINGDLCRLEDLEKSIEGISDVIILGGIVGDPLSKKYPEETIKINYDGIKLCLNLLFSFVISAISPADDLALKIPAENLVTEWEHLEGPPKRKYFSFPPKKYLTRKP